MLKFILLLYLIYNETRTLQTEHFAICIFIKYYYGGCIKDEMSVACEMHGRDKKCMHNLKRSNCRAYKADGMTLKWILRQQGVRALSGFTWFRIGSSGSSVNMAIKIPVP
jgi:hypothetical protein